MGKGGFSWKRATGVTRIKRRVSRATGVPLTKSGRQRKMGKMVSGGGCMLPVLMAAAVVLMWLVVFWGVKAVGGHASAL